MTVTAYTTEYLDEAVRVIAGPDRAAIDRIVAILADIRETGGRLGLPGGGLAPGGQPPRPEAQRDGVGVQALRTGRPAVFLDRDGTVNESVFYVDSGKWEAPRSPEDFRLVPQAGAGRRDLQAAGFALVLVSSQPNFAIGKASLEMMAVTRCWRTAGLTVVSSGTGGSREIVRDGIDGLLFRPNHHEDLAMTLKQLADDPAGWAGAAGAALKAWLGLHIRCPVRSGQNFSDRVRMPP